MYNNLGNLKKIVIAVILIGFPVLLLLWTVGPRNEHGIYIRVLFVSYSGDAISVGKPTVTVLSSTKNSVIVIDRKEWDLPMDTQDFYRNNIILECTTNAFPVHWGFIQRLGENSPPVTIHTSRIVDHFHEKNSYRFVSTINLMPHREASTGKYVCDNINETINDFSYAENYVYIYFTGGDVFLSKTSISIESTNGKELNIPCPVSNPETIVSLYLEQGENEILLSAPNQSYTTYDPQKGFILSTKFLEEKDPWGRYICKVANDPNLHSGYVNIIPTKDYIVNVTPANSTISLSTGDFDGKFVCEAKESIILQMSKIKKFCVVIYKMNISWEFPYVARVQYELKDLRHFSSITCKTNTGMLLHTWKFAASMPTVSMSFQHDENANEFSCCSENAAKMKPHLEILDCGSPSECAVRQYCFKQNECINKNKIVEDVIDCKIFTVSQVASGMVQCAVGKRLQQLYYFFNGFRLLSDENYLHFYDLPVKEFMMISTFPTEVNNSFSKNIKYKFVCKGSRFIFSGGFVWFIMRDGSLNEIRGEGYFDQNWIHNWVELLFQDYETTAIYCVAPVLNSSSEWRNVTLQIDYRK